MKVHLNLKSSNVKTGPIPVSTTSAATCPETCPLNVNLPEKPDRDARRAALKAQGLKACYASSGPLALHWREVTNGTRGMEWGEFCASIAALPAGALWRHNQAGDLPGRGDEVNATALLALVIANSGRKGFTYTHKPINAKHPLGLKNLFAIRKAVGMGFAINLSANSLEHADRLADFAETSRNGATPHVVAIVPASHPERSTTPAGRPVIVCPEQTGKAKNCAECGLCARMDRKPIIAFRAH